MTTSEHSGPLQGLMEPDRLQAVWAGAIVAALVVHSMAFVFMQAQPAKPKPQTITLALPPPPPPPPVEAPPPPPEPKKPPPKPLSEVPPPPLPPAPVQSETPPPPDAPPPKAAEQVVALGPSTGDGVKVAVGSPDGVEGAPPVTSSGPPPADVAPSNRGQSGPPPKTWDENGYKSGAWDMMNRNKKYPRKAQVMGLEGKCVVSVKLNHDGSLAAPPKILGKGTGHESLDEECVAMALRTTFPPIPEHIPAPVSMRFPIEFVLENR